MSHTSHDPRQSKTSNVTYHKSHASRKRQGVELCCHDGWQYEETNSFASTPIAAVAAAESTNTNQQRNTNNSNIDEDDENNNKNNKNDDNNKK